MFGSIYDLDPQIHGTFDLVFCGSLLLHLQNPWRALANLRSVARSTVIIETFIDTELDHHHPDRPWLRVGHREYDRVLGENCIYWRFSTRALLEMLEYVGFAASSVGEEFALPPNNVPVRAFTAYVKRPDDFRAAGFAKFALAAEERDRLAKTKDGERAEGAGAQLAWTGERCIPGEADFETLYEHIHRYLFASSVVAGKEVLDIGSGEGYGAAWLARSAKRVVGIDIDSPSVTHSAHKYVRDNLKFVCGSALDLSMCDDASFDVVTCFETIEHLAEHDQLMRSIKRVLRADGVFLVSTPDRDIYTTGHYNNPFHVRELNRQEFEELLDRYFGHRVLYTQTFTVGSAISRLSGPDADVTALQFAGSRSTDGWTEDPASAGQYLVAVASDAVLPQLPGTSHLHDTSAELAKAAHGWKEQAAAWERDSAERGRASDTWRERYEAIALSRTWRVASALRSVISNGRSALRVVRWRP